MSVNLSAAVSRLWRAAVASELRRDVLETYIVRILVVVLTFATTVVITRTLGPTGRGFYAVAATLGAIGVQFSNLGLHASNIYYVSQDRALLPTLIGNTLAVVFVACMLVAVGAIGFVLWPAMSPLRGSLLFLALAFVPVSLGYMLTQGLLLGVNKVRVYNRIEVGGKLLALGLICVLALGHQGTVEVLFGITLLSVLVSFLWALLRLRSVSAEPVALSMKLFRQCLPVGVNAYMIAFFGFLVMRIDLLMVKYMLGATEAGYYSISQVLSENTMLLPVVIGLLLFPKLSAIRDKEAKLHLANKAALVTAALMLPAVVVAAFAAAPVISIAFGRNFLAAVAPFVWLLPGIYFLGIEVVLVQLLNSEGFPKIIVIAWLADTIVNVGLNLWAIPLYGITGASVVSSICYFLIFVVIFAVIRKRFRVPRPAPACASDFQPLQFEANHPTGPDCD
jgi:O-antigen/teichoic acid export membrane protein